MATPLNVKEGQSTYRPPRFNGQYYGWWKIIMRDFIMAGVSELWDVICDGPFVLMKTVGEGTVAVLKTRKKYNDADRKAIEKNFKQRRFLFSTKEIWEALQTAYEGTTQVKPSKIDMLTTEHELFKIKKDESI
ncbi:uncharacterized protein LOC142180807 [Nicotiana tabacum]|uniref:Uncharacterized protein LOC142180807 n=1 Tax=Nicotiana tabacum TaxID=4097 RepID=A0AC58UHM7_TOBAC